MQIHGLGFPALGCVPRIPLGVCHYCIKCGQENASHICPRISCPREFCGARFRPGSRAFAWCVPKGATFVVEQKEPKPMAPSLASSERADTSLRRAAQLATLGQGLPVDESVRPRASQQASERGETNNSVTHRGER